MQFSYCISTASCCKENYIMLYVKICSYDFVVCPCSRSQCIINVRRVANPDEVNDASNCAILTIADLAGAEKEKRTGNQVPYSFGVWI